MLDLPIVDSHVHLWDPTRFRMPNLDANPFLNRPYGLSDYARSTEGLPVGAMVYVQVEVAPPYALLETRWAAERAQEDPRLQGIVAWAPLEFGDRCRAFLEELIAAGPLIKGIRRPFLREPDPAFCLRHEYIRGVQILSEYGLSCDIGIAHHQLENTIRMVEQCPRTSFILDHIAMPDIRNGGLDPWREDLKNLASFPNVACKISGIVTGADRERWTPSDLAPYVEHALQVFGEDRVAFAGDWPIVLQASTYSRWVDALASLTAHLGPAARRKLWAGNARRFYRLVDDSTVAPRRTSGPR